MPLRHPIQISRLLSEYLFLRSLAMQPMFNMPAHLDIEEDVGYPILCPADKMEDVNHMLQLAPGRGQREGYKFLEFPHILYSRLPSAPLLC